MGQNFSNVFRKVSSGNMEGPTKERVNLTLIMQRKWHFSTSDYSSASFKLVMDKDSAGPQVKVPNWSKANFDGITQELAKVG